MQAGASTGGRARTGVADLRASLRADDMRSRPPAARNRRAAAPAEEADPIAATEQVALAQHTTSLLSSGRGRHQARASQRQERRTGGLFVQLVLVMACAGSVAWIADPRLIPSDWYDYVRDLVGQYFPDLIA